MARRSLIAAGLLLTLVSGCTNHVRGSGSPLPPPAGSPAQGTGAQSVGALELTPLAALPSSANQSLLRIGLRARNTGNGLVRFTPAAAKLRDARGTTAGTVTTPDATYPPFPPDTALGPGQVIVGYLTYTVSPPFQPDALVFQSASWPVDAIPRQPMSGSVLPPRRAAPLNQPVTIMGTDNVADPKTNTPPAPVELLVRALNLIDPSPTGAKPPTGYRQVAVTVLMRNIGPNPYWVNPATSMRVFDADGYAYPALPGDSFPTGVLPRNATRTGQVTFPIPTRARPSYIEISLTAGGPAAIAQWTTTN